MQDAKSSTEGKTLNFSPGENITVILSFMIINCLCSKCVLDLLVSNRFYCSLL